ncbi:MAG: Rieske 2Fe-2S domain-containing protein [Candidatus Limnocylindria bacterium]
MVRWLDRLIALNDRWAAPFGEFNHRWLTALFRPIRPIKDLLHGTWLGHPLHPASTDLPIGAFLVALVLDLAGQPQAALVATAVGQVTFLLSMLSGLADYTDTDGRARIRATIHGTIMVVAGALTAGSMILRDGGAASGSAPTILLAVGLAVILLGAYIGGDVVFALGNMVSRHAFRGPGTKWVRLDTGDVVDLGRLPEATPTKMRAGINDLVLVRVGDTVHALHAVCAHAGGPLDAGTVTPDGCLECPWHGARYRLADGHNRRGPSVYDQPAYEIRAAEGGGYEVRRAAS